MGFFDDLGKAVNDVAHGDLSGAVKDAGAAVNDVGQAAGQAAGQTASAVGNFFAGVAQALGDLFPRGPEGPLHPVGPDGHAPGHSPTTSDSSATSGEGGSGRKIPPAVEAPLDVKHHDSIHRDDATRAETPAEQAAHKLLDAVDHGPHLGEPIKPHPSPIDPDLGDPNRPPHPTPIGPGGEPAGAVDHNGSPGIPSVLTHLANGLPATAADGTSNTISLSELSGALGGRHPVGDLPPAGHGGGVIDPPQPLHVADLHVGDHAIDVSSFHLDHGPIGPSPAVHFDTFHH